MTFVSSQILIFEEYPGPLSKYNENEWVTGSMQLQHYTKKYHKRSPHYLYFETSEAMR